MLINGQPVLTTDRHSIIEQLMRLPSGIVRTARGGDTTEFSFPFSKLKSNADLYIEEGRRTGSEACFRHAATHLLTGVRLAKEQNRLDVASGFSMSLGANAKAMGDGHSALSYYRDSMEMAQYLGLRNLAIMAASSFYVEALLEQGKGFRDVSDDLTLSRETIVDCFLKGSSYEEPDHEAAAILQREYGVSDDRKIGTLGVGPCGILVLRNPATKWTSNGHIDEYVSAEKIKDMLDGQPDGPEMPLLEACLWGINHDPVSPFGDTHHENLDKIIKFLLPRNINVVSAHIFDEDGPSSCVVDPHSGTLTEAALVGDPTRLLFQMCGSRYNADTSKLNKAFSLLNGKKELEPFFLTYDQARSVDHDVRTHTEHEIFLDFMRIYPIAAAEQAICDVHAQRITDEANILASDLMIQQIDHVLKMVSDTGRPMPPEQRRAVYQAVRWSGKYIGEGSAKLNKMKTGFMITEILGAANRNDYAGLRLEQIAKMKIG